MRLASGLLAVASVLVVTALGAASALADPSPEGAIAELNTWRAELGESLVSSTPVAAWDTGCEHHGNYEHLNGNSLTHEEASNHPGYTADGYEAGRNSVLAGSVSAPGPTPDASLLPGPVWDAAVFHRAALLQPRLGQTGFDAHTYQEGGVFRSFECMWVQGPAIDNARTTPGLTLYPSPGNGAYDVPTTFPAGTESPDPASESGVPAGATLGWLLNVEIDGPWSSAEFGYSVDAHDVTATLAPDGTSNFVPLVVSQCGPSGCGGSGGSGEGVYFGGGFGIFPTQALAANTTYRVVLTGGTVTEQSSHTNYPIPAGYSWCFSTGPTYTPSADCAAPTTAAEEPVNPNASTAISVTPPPGTTGGGGASGGTSGGAAGGAPGAVPAPPPPPTVVAHCVVPRLAGKKLASAKKKIAAADCKLGTVMKHRGATAGSGTVVRQSAKPGTSLPAGTKVGVTLAKG